MTSNSTVALPPARDTKYGRMLAERFVSNSTLPAAADVIVIGGGIMGVSTALFLARQGVSVVVIEKAEIACEASSRAFGWVSEMMLDPAKQPMTQLSKRLWGELQVETGELGFRQYGLVSIAETDDEMAMFDGWLESSRHLISSDTQMMSVGDLRKRFPNIRGDFKGGIFAPSDGGCEPTISTTRLAEAARRAGATIVTDCAVRGISREGGRVAGVYTESGFVETSTVVSAVNTWSRLLLGNLGIEIPQLYVTMSMGRTAPADGPPGAGGPMPWSWRRQIDGAYTIGGLMGVRVPVTRDAIALRKRMKPLMEMMGGGTLDFGRQALLDLRLSRKWDPQKTSPFEKLRVLTGTVDRKVPGLLLDGHKRAFASMENAQLTDVWAGPIPVTPDNKPIIGPIDEIPGLHLITACSYGISWAPAVGKVMSEMITGAKKSFDVHAFRASRFTDGSPLELAH